MARKRSDLVIDSQSTDIGRMQINDPDFLLNNKPILDELEVVVKDFSGRIREIAEKGGSHVKVHVTFEFSGS